MAVYPNPYVLNIIDLQNVVRSAGGGDTNADLSNQVAALRGMVDTTNHIVYADALRDFSGTGQMNIESDLNLATNWVTGCNVQVLSNGGAVSLGGGGTSLTAGDTVVSAGGGESTLSVTVGGTSVFSVGAGGDVTASGAMYATGFYTLSDAGVKEGIVPLGGGSLDRVCALSPASWQWAGAVGGGAGVGFVAQDVARVFPELVRGVEDGDGGSSLRVDVVGLLGHVVAAIKELRAASPAI